MTHLRQAFDHVAQALKTQSSVKPAAPSTTEVPKVIHTTINKTIKRGGNDLGGFVVKDDDDNIWHVTKGEECVPIEYPKKDEIPDKPKGKGLRKLCALGKATIWPPTTSGKDSDWAIKLATHMRGIGTDVLNKRVMAVQELLLLMFSNNGVDNVTSTAQYARDTAAALKSTIALGLDSKHTPSEFRALANGIEYLQKRRSAVAVAQVDSITAHAQVAHILEQYVDELDTRTTALYHGYEAATAQPNHRYGFKDNKESYRLYLVEKSVEAIYEEHAGDLRNHLSDKVSGYRRCFHSFHYLFFVLHPSASTCVSHQGRVNHDG
ncbi:hypothetical protein KCU95_g15779, partial [Aureobasidium melanogenum]